MKKGRWDVFVGSGSHCNKNLRKWQKWDKLQLLYDLKQGFVNKITE